ncbi:ATP-binding protein [Thermodesulfobacteriota bacterium]
MEEKDRPIASGTTANNGVQFNEVSIRENKLGEYSDVYQDLFDHVPCFITVQDKNYKLLRYNKEFYDAFDPKPGDYCYQAYKGRNEKCAICPVEKTFMDGQSHLSEESGPNRYGTTLYWVVKTSPIKNSRGEIVAVMEMCLDITHKKKLEEELEISERKYRAIFKNIPNPLFVLDAESLKILDCNGSVKTVYGYSGDEIINEYFPMFFKTEERDKYASMLKSSTIINQARHLTKDGKEIFVNIRISPSEHLDQKSYLVTTSDITQQLEIEQQLIQASKMATLGEMATGVAHELNQPLSVIKTASNFFMRKINDNGAIEGKTLLNLSGKIAGNVDRATKIINHMREFGRKSDMNLEKICINDVLKRAYDVLSQQLKLRGIEVIWKLQEDLPEIEADSIRLEQVFINLLLNARDAIEEKGETVRDERLTGFITIKTSFAKNNITVEIQDTGPGIPEAIKDKIFEPFFTTKKVGKGTGLGLSISYGIVKECGGSIQAASGNDEGACFKIRLPLQNIL